MQIFEDKELLAALRKLPTAQDGVFEDRRFRDSSCPVRVKTPDEMRPDQSVLAPHALLSSRELAPRKSLPDSFSPKASKVSKKRRGVDLFVLRRYALAPAHSRCILRFCDERLARQWEEKLLTLIHAVTEDYLGDHIAEDSSSECEAANWNKITKRTLSVKTSKKSHGKKKKFGHGARPRVLSTVEESPLENSASSSATTVSSRSGRDGELRHSLDVDSRQDSWRRTNTLSWREYTQYNLSSLQSLFTKENPVTA